MVGLAPGQDTHPKLQLVGQPAWVVDNPAPESVEVPTNQIAGGVHYVLFDQQYNYSVEPPQFFTRSSRRIVNDAGAQDTTQVSIDFNPNFQSLALHRCEIVRDGRVIPLLDAATLKIIQREEDLDRRLYDGALSVLIFLPDIRVGDLLEYAFTRTGANPAMAGHISEFLYAGFSVPVEEVYYRVMWPDGLPRGVRYFGPPWPPEETPRDGYADIVWRRTRMAPVVVEDQAPHGYWDSPFIQLTSMTNWQSVAEWARALYRQPVEWPDEIKARLAAWRALPDRDKQAEAVRRFVQDEIRYLGMEIGVQSFEPAQPGRVCRQRFGDCKDKSLLFVELLDALSIPAWPALVDTDRRGGIVDLLPTPHAFNHCIAMMEGEGGPVWVDVTDHYQRGPISGTAVTDYGKALPIREGVADLVDMEVAGQQHGKKLVVESFRVHDIDKAEGVAVLDVETTYEGMNADTMRAYLAAASIEEVTRQYYDFYTGFIPALTNRSVIQIDDDEDANRLVILESYRIDQFWTDEEGDGVLTFFFTPHGVNGLLPDPEVKQRTAPLAMPHPMDYRHTIAAHLPNPSEWSFEEEDNQVDNAGFFLAQKVTYEDGTLHLAWDLESKQDAIPALAVARYLEDRKEAVSLMNDFGIQYVHGNGENGGEVPAGDVASLLLAYNWFLLCFELMAALVTGLIWWMVYRKHTRGPPPLPGHSPLGPGPEGIGGWLVLPAIGFAIAPFSSAYNVFYLPRAYTLDVIVDVAGLGESGTSAAYSAVILLESIYFPFAWATLCFLAVAFFMRRRFLPRYYIVLMLALSGMELILLAATAQVDPEVWQIDMTRPTAVTLGSLAATLVWVLYFARSHRVKRTFTR